jgi:Intracellular proteinase inhibitor
MLATLSTNRQSYRPGQSVRATLVIQNVSDSSITVSHNANTDGITVSLGAKMVWRSSRTVPNASIQQMVQPGGSVSWNAVWNGRSNQRGAKHLGPGTYTIQATEGGYSATTTFRIVG